MQVGHQAYRDELDDQPHKLLETETVTEIETENSTHGRGAANSAAAAELGGKTWPCMFQAFSVGVQQFAEANTKPHAVELLRAFEIGQQSYVDYMQAFNVGVQNNSAMAVKSASISDFRLELSSPRRLPRQHGSYVQFIIRQRRDATKFVKVSKRVITIYQNIMFIVNGIETAYSECWTYNTTKSVIDEFHMPAHLFKHLPNFRYQSLAECWFELGPPDPSYKTGSLLGDGADPRSPWGRARGRLDLREVPAGTTPIRRETILLWTNGIMHEPIEIRRSGPVSNCHLFENSRRLRDNLGCTFEDYKRRKISKANANGRSGYVTASEMKMEIVPFLTFMSRAETVSKDTSQTSGTTAQVQSQLDMKWCKDGVESVFNNLGRMKMMFDTGNTPRTIVSSELNAYLKAARDSDTQFLSAFGPGKTGADKIGTLPMSILGLKPHEETALDLEVTTIESVNTSLMSYYQMFQAGFDLHITAGTAGDSCGDDELPDLVSDDDFLNSKGVLRHRVTGQTIPLFPCRDTRAWYVVFQLDLPNMPDSFTKFVSESC
eukprot:COSAG01_NODE_7121_length_3340_cov_4.218760_1_plen_546_part_10